MTQSKKMDLMTWLALALVALAVVYLGSGANEPAQVLRVAVGKTGTFSANAGDALRQVLERQGYFKVVFVEVANSVEAAGSVREDKADIALMAPAAVPDSQGWVGLSPLASLYAHWVSPRDQSQRSLMRVPAEQIYSGDAGSDSMLLSFALRKRMELVRQDALLVDNIQPAGSARFALMVDHPLSPTIATRLRKSDQQLTALRESSALAMRDGQWVVSRLPAAIHAYTDNQQPENDVTTAATPLVVVTTEDLSPTMAARIVEIMDSSAARSLLKRLGADDTAPVWDSLPHHAAVGGNVLTYEQLIERELAWWFERKDLVATVLLFAVLLLLQSRWWISRRKALRDEAVTSDTDKAFQELLRIEQRMDVETDIGELQQLRLDIQALKAKVLKSMAGTSLMGSPLMLGFLSQWTIVDQRLLLITSAYRPAGKAGTA